MDLITDTLLTTGPLKKVSEFSEIFCASAQISWACLTKISWGNFNFYGTGVGANLKNVRFSWLKNLITDTLLTTSPLKMVSEFPEIFCASAQVTRACLKKISWGNFNFHGTGVGTNLKNVRFSWLKDLVTDTLLTTSPLKKVSEFSEIFCASAQISRACLTKISWGNFNFYGTGVGTNLKNVRFSWLTDLVTDTLLTTSHLKKVSEFSEIFCASTQVSRACLKKISWGNFNFYGTGVGTNLKNVRFSWLKDLVTDTLLTTSP